MQSLEDIPVYFADFLGINLGAAQIILSVIVLFSLLLPVMYLAKGTRALAIELVVLFLGECLLVGMGWMPFWILIATVAVMAIAIALLGTKVVIGEG